MKHIPQVNLTINIAWTYAQRRVVLTVEEPEKDAVNKIIARSIRYIITRNAIPEHPSNWEPAIALEVGDFEIL